MIYRHYIRTDKKMNVIKSFSSAFEEPAEGDILLCETEERHADYNPLKDLNGIYYYRWDGRSVAAKKYDEINAELESVLKQRELDLCLRLRREAYQTEADGLFFDWQRGKVTKEAWESKVSEIRGRYPKPDMPEKGGLLGRFFSMFSGK